MSQSFRRSAADMVYGIIGLGLMGGSLAKAFRESIVNVCGCGGKIFACDRSSAVLTQAKEEGIIDKGWQPEQVKEMLPLCDVVYICLYPEATRVFLSENAPYFKESALVTDIAGVKSIVINGLSQDFCSKADFIPGHPMAGSEKEGYGHSSARIFAGRNYIIMPQPGNTAEHIEFLKNLVTEIGFTRIIETSAETHDRRIAFTSQLCHVIASALVASAEDTRITEFGGGSYEDLTRIAMINAPLWTELFLENRKELLEQITHFETELSRIRLYIEQNNPAELAAMLEDVRQKRSAMSRIETSV